MAVKFYENAITVEASDAMHEVLTNELLARGEDDTYVALAAHQVAWEATIEPSSLPIVWHKKALHTLRRDGDDPLGLYSLTPQSAYYEVRKSSYFKGVQLGAYVAQKFLQAETMEVSV